MSRHRAGMLGFGTALWVLLLAAFFRWSLGLLAPDNLHSSGQQPGTAEYIVQAMGSSQGKERQFCDLTLVGEDRGEEEKENAGMCM